MLIDKYSLRFTIFEGTYASVYYIIYCFRRSRGWAGVLGLSLTDSSQGPREGSVWTTPGLFFPEIKPLRREGLKSGWPVSPGDTSQEAMVPVYELLWSDYFLFP